MRFTVNGVLQPVAKTIPKSSLPEGDAALFPHILTRNYAFEVNLGNTEEPLCSTIPEEVKDFVFLDKSEVMVAGPFRPQSREECEVSIRAVLKIKLILHNSPKFCILLIKF